MSKSKIAYRLMVLVLAVYIGYVLYANFVYDPQAAAFLSLKTAPARLVNVDVWLRMMDVHIVFAILSMVSGAVNFSARMLSKHRKLHRFNGYVYLTSVLIVVVTSGYMAPYATGGKLSSIAFNFLNLLWPVMTIAAIVKIRKKQAEGHRKWMIRSYAMVFTNMSIHLFTSLLHDGFGLDYTFSYILGVYASIVLLLTAAEIVIRTAFRNLNRTN